jgi:peptidoglycan hydrolase-like protein with peptidoglycan-binding domain
MTRVVESAKRRVVSSSPRTTVAAPVTAAKPKAVAADSFALGGAGKPSVASVAAAKPASTAAPVGFPLKNDATLADVAAGKLELAKGAKGPSVQKVQEALELAGYKLPKFGADADFGGETQQALKKFQTASGISPATGRLDATTLSKLDAASAKGLKSPAYDKLFADGVLNSTLAVGFDEAGWDKIESKKIVEGLVGDGAANKGQGYTQLNVKTATDAELKKAGIDPKTVDKDAAYFVKTFQHNGKDVQSVVKMITPDTPNAKDKFAKAMGESEMVMYCGHGRYGSGPDFDDIKSTTGNYVIGKPFEPGHVSIGDSDLKKTKMTDDYQLMMFSGCNTYRYMDDLRSVPANKTSKNLDIVGSTDELWWNNMGTNTLTMLEGVTSGKSMNEIQSNLEAGNREAKDKPTKKYWRTDGFADN